MNRYDEIKAVARDIASNVHADPAKRDAMADDLIKLCAAMIAAVGKDVAVYGESGMNQAEDREETDLMYGLYRTGERVQSAAREAEERAVNTDLDRWSRPTPGDPCRCGHVPSVHDGRTCTGEQFNGEACQGGPCEGFVSRPRNGGWTHQDRRPDGLQHAALLASQADPFQDVPSNPFGLKVSGTSVIAATVAQVERSRCNDCGRTTVEGHRATCPRATHVASPVPPSFRCCKPDGPCALHHGGRPATGGCCYLKSEVCPSHG